MTRESRMWLFAAVGVAGVVAVIVLIFGYDRPPQFPSLYEAGAPTIQETVAHTEFGSEDCVWVFEVATGESRELYCDNWVWPESWNADGNLRVHAGNGHGQILIIDPDTGAVLGTESMDEGPEGDEGGPPPEEEWLHSRSTEGRITLTSGSGTDEVTLIDVEGPRNYRFHQYGITAGGEYAWVCDSEERLLVVAMDGSGGPWLVTEGISEPVWK